MAGVELAKKLRAWQAEHPVADLAIGFIPIAGQAYGAASAAAALADPDASKLEKGMSGLTFLPGGKAAKKAGIVIGEKLASPAQRTMYMIARLRDKANRALSPDVRPNIDKDIFDQTGGWFKGNDGHWRLELDDSEATVDQLRQQLGSGRKDISANMVFNHPRLVENSDEARKLMDDVKVEGVPMKKNSVASYNSDTNTIKLNSNDVPNDPRDRSSMLHELQHAIQERERFPSKGANLSEVGHNAYVRNWGEIEARVVEQRRNMTPEQRMKFPFKQHFAAEADRVYGQRTPTYYPKRDELDAMITKGGLDPADVPMNY